jgi:hypothetical protein
MAYYPKSQIKTDLYSEGEYILSTTRLSYIGYYHELSNGKKYTGKNPQDNPIVELILDPNFILTNNTPLLIDPVGLPNPNQIIQTTPFSGDFKVILNQEGNARFIPSYAQTLPTQQDKDLGVFLRYFCKKNNENLYIEINKEQFTKFQNKDIDVAWDLYTPKQVLWQIKGDKTQTYNANKNNVSLIEQRDKWYGFTQYFKDRFLKYYLES